jgi:hypothetical protein
MSVGVGSQKTVDVLFAPLRWDHSIVLVHFFWRKESCHERYRLYLGDRSRSCAAHLWWAGSHCKCSRWVRIFLHGPASAGFVPRKTEATSLCADAHFVESLHN